MPASPDDTEPVLVIHGGAGAIPKAEATPGRIEAIRADLRRSLEAGYAALKDGAGAVEAVERAVKAMEDSPYFNAGHGAALNREGMIEHDAAIMDGRDRAAGAICATGRIRNPISAARAVMERTPHVLLAGAGAEQFAREQGLALAPNWYFFTPERLAALERVQAAKRARAAASESDRHGTVGAVARDRTGHLAAATSTGGFADKLPGRVGDSPIVGAGTFADDATLAFSGTGHGETFIRLALGHRLACLVELKGLDLAAAAAQAMAELQAHGGSGGFIAVDRHGAVALPFNTPGMYRGIARAGRIGVAIFDDDIIAA